MLFTVVRAIFVWPWNENAWTKQKQQTNRNRAIWLVYRTDTNARGFWLVKRTLGWKNFMLENFLEINRYFALTSYCNTIGSSNNAFSILGLSLAGKRRVHVLIFSLIGRQNKWRNDTYRNHFSSSYKNRPSSPNLAHQHWEGKKTAKRPNNFDWDCSNFCCCFCLFVCFFFAIFGTSRG